MITAPGASNASAGTSATWSNGDSPSTHPGTPVSAPIVSHRKLTPTRPNVSAVLARGTTA